IPRPDGSVDEVRLEGTFNAPPQDLAGDSFFAEIQRILKPGGRVVAHGLAAEAPLAQAPALPGLAALVRHVPAAGEVADRLLRAGFTGVHFEKLAPTCCLPASAGNLREMRLIAWRATQAPAPRNRHVLYKGPLQQVTDDEGTVYPRGEKVAVTAESCER